MPSCRALSQLDSISIAHHHLHMTQFARTQQCNSLTDERGLPYQRCRTGPEARLRILSSSSGCNSCSVCQGLRGGIRQAIKGLLCCDCSHPRLACMLVGGDLYALSSRFGIRCNVFFLLESSLRKLQSSLDC